MGMAEDGRDTDLMTWRESSPDTANVDIDDTEN